MQVYHLSLLGSETGLTHVSDVCVMSYSGSSRLGVAAPLSDQYMQRYWPAGVPWRGSPMIKKTLPLAVYYCPLPECPQNFGSLEMFMQHVRCGHTVQELRKFGVPSLSGVEWIGRARYVCHITLHYKHL